jgi:hypothetical protein
MPHSKSRRTKMARLVSINMIADLTMASRTDGHSRSTNTVVGRHTGPFLPPSPSPHRRSMINKREKSFFVAHVISESRRYRCHLLNISQSGALIAGADLPKNGEIFSLELASTFRIATVVWNSSGRRGIIFDTVLTREQLTACL